VEGNKFIKEKAEDLVATLKSKQAELAIFSLSTSDQELVGLKKGMEERRLAHSRMIDDMYSKLSVLTDGEFW